MAAAWQSAPAVRAQQPQAVPAWQSAPAVGQQPQNRVFNEQEIRQAMPLPENMGQPKPDGSLNADNSVRAVARGVPVVGSMLDELNASWQASLSPIAEQSAQLDAKVGARNPVQMPIAPGANFQERYGNALDMQRGTDQAFDDQHPVASTGLKVAGGVASGMGAMRAAPQAASAAFGVTRGTAPLVTKMAAGAGSGAALGGLHGFGEGEGGFQERLGTAQSGAIAGGVTGGVVPVAGHLIGRAAGTKPQTITMDALKAAKKSAYQAARNAGVVVKQSAWDQFRQNVLGAMSNKNVFNPKLHTGTDAALDTIAKEAGDLTLERADLVRQVINDAADSAANDGDLMRVMKIKEMFDGFLDNLNPQTDIIAGNAPAAVQTLKQARELAAREFKAKDVQKLIDLAENSARTNFGQAGVEQATRVQFKNFLARLIKYPSERARFTPEELKAIERVAEGGPVGNVLRELGKWAPKGPMATTLSTVGGYTLGESILPGAGGPVALGVAGLGALSRMGATQATSKNAMMAQELMRAGGALPKSVPSARADEMARLLLQSAAPAQLPYAQRAPR